jgi:hypothetical protein
MLQFNSHGTTWVSMPNTAVFTVLFRPQAFWAIGTGAKRMFSAGFVGLHSSLIGALLLAAPALFAVIVARAVRVLMLRHSRQVRRLCSIVGIEMMAIAQ